MTRWFGKLSPSQLAPAFVSWTVEQQARFLIAVAACSKLGPSFVRWYELGRLLSEASGGGYARAIVTEIYEGTKAQP